jgi:hypothetical protein
VAHAVSPCEVVDGIDGNSALCAMCCSMEDKKKKGYMQSWTVRIPSPVDLNDVGKLVKAPSRARSCDRSRGSGVV